MTDPKTVTVQERLVWHARDPRRRDNRTYCGHPIRGAYGRLAGRLSDANCTNCIVSLMNDPAVLTQLNGGRNVALTSSKTGDER